MGMGVIWYFEIISWAAGAEQAKWTYFFDCFNMLQVVFCRNTLEKQEFVTKGVWVFIIFVCKRNVLKVVLKKRDRLYSKVRKSTMENSGDMRNLDLKNISYLTR